MSSSSTRCAACKYLRRRCTENCILAPYFPASHPARFACVHMIFGASNVTRMIQQLPVDQRSQAADAIASEAYWRVRDPIYGSVGVITSLQQQIYTVHCELAEVQAQIAICIAQQQQNQQQTQQNQPPENENQYFDVQPDYQSVLDQTFPNFPPNFPNFS